MERHDIEADEEYIIPRLIELMTKNKIKFKNGNTQNIFYFRSKYYLKKMLALKDSILQEFEDLKPVKRNRKTKAEYQAIKEEKKKQNQDDFLEKRQLRELGMDDDNINEMMDRAEKKQKEEEKKKPFCIGAEDSFNKFLQQMPEQLKKIKKDGKFDKKEEPTKEDQEDFIKYQKEQEDVQSIESMASEVYEGKKKGRRSKKAMEEYKEEQRKMKELYEQVQKAKKDDKKVVIKVIEDKKGNIKVKKVKDVIKTEKVQEPIKEQEQEQEPEQEINNLNVQEPVTIEQYVADIDNAFHKQVLNEFVEKEIRKRGRPHKETKYTDDPNYREKQLKYLSTKIQCPDCDKFICRSSMAKHKRSPAHFEGIKLIKNKRLADKVDQLCNLLEGRNKN